jgi:apolipoprotein D and lipocalin family protein
MKYLFLTLIVALTACSPKAMSQPDQTIVNDFNFELEKYLGTWYEIARFDHLFERGLEKVTATYSLRNDGKIKVLNQGVKNGKQKSAVGKARAVNANEPRRFEVSFFLFFYAPYNILEIDNGYNYALIGSNTEDYLWILSRTPQMDNETYEMLLGKARARGYNTDKLIKVTQ